MRRSTRDTSAAIRSGLGAGTRYHVRVANPSFRSAAVIRARLDGRKEATGVAGRHRDTDPAKAVAVDFDPAPEQPKKARKAKAAQLEF